MSSIIWKIVLSILAAIYVISPIDIIPDFIPMLGYVDDGTMLIIFLLYLWKGKLPDFIPWARGTSRGNREKGSKSHTTARGKDPYAVLGVKPGASREEIRAAYRTAAQEYHPDKVSHLGPELQKVAKQKFMEIQEAYEKLGGKD